MRNRGNNILIIAYNIKNEIFFISSIVILHRLFTVKNKEGLLLGQKTISNCNSECITIPKINKTVEISIISKDVEYKKTLTI